MAVRHAADHIHLVATLARQDEHGPGSRTTTSGSGTPATTRNGGSDCGPPPRLIERPVATGRKPASSSILPATPAGGPRQFAPTQTGILDGKVVLVDPGHNGGNAAASSIIGRLIWNGRNPKPATPPANDRQRVQRGPVQLERRCRSDRQPARGRSHGRTHPHLQTGVGPCVTQRADIGSDVHADAAVSIHADGGPPDGRGFAILKPVPDGINNAIVGPSAILGADLRAAFAAGTGEPVSSYDGVNGIQPRDDLAGTNLSTVPKVFIECANMRNATDAALLTSPTWQARRLRPSQQVWQPSSRTTKNC